MLKLDDTCKINQLYVGTNMYFWPCFILIILGYADSVSRGVAITFGLLVKTSACTNVFIIKYLVMIGAWKINWIMLAFIPLDVIIFRPAPYPHQTLGVAASLKWLLATGVLVLLLDGRSHKPAIWFIHSKYWGISTLVVSRRAQYTWNCYPVEENESVCLCKDAAGELVCCKCVRGII